MADFPPFQGQQRAGFPQDSASVELPASGVYTHAVGIPVQANGGAGYGGGNQFFEEAVGQGFSASSPLTQMGLQYGADWMGKQSSFMTAQYSKNLSLLRYYFTVNNSYVMNKIFLIIFPYKHKHWKRRVLRQQDQDLFLPARDDINAPDLYIPLMAFITYVLIIGFSLGDKFTPDVLGIISTTALFTNLFEIVGIKLSLYLLNSPTIALLDILAYVGYKYVGLVLTIMSALLSSSTLVYNIVLIVTGIANSVFLVKTLKLVFPDSSSVSFGESGATSHSHTPRSRNYFLLCLGLCEVLVNYYLSYDIHIY